MDPRICPLRAFPELLRRHSIGGQIPRQNAITAMLNRFGAIPAGMFTRRAKSAPTFFRRTERRIIAIGLRLSARCSNIRKAVSITTDGLRPYRMSSIITTVVWRWVSMPGRRAISFSTCSALLLVRRTPGSDRRSQARIKGCRVLMMVAGLAFFFEPVDLLHCFEFLISELRQMPDEQY